MKRKGKDKEPPWRDEVVEKWLATEFQNPKTRAIYRSALRRFSKVILNGQLFKKAIAEYKADRELIADLKVFMNSFGEKPTKTRNSYSSAIKMFFAEQGIPISDEEWRKAKRRQKKASVYTVDRAPTQKELKTITSYMNLKARALTLFLASSGCRIGETLQLEVEDLKLEADPPRATIRNENTKFGSGGRLVFFSYEARDAMRNWLKIKDGITKRDGSNYSGLKVWNMSFSNALYLWNTAVEKAGLTERDKGTRRRTLHLHSLRKFFRSNIGLPWDIVQGMMGHHAYLDKAYQRIGEAKLAEMYRNAMPNVSVYTVERSRKDEIRRFAELSGTPIPELLKTLQEMMLATGEGAGGGKSRKLPIDEDYILGLDDGEIGKLIRATLKRELTGNSSSPMQKVISEDELEAYLEKGWMYISSLNNGSGKCIVKRA